MREILFRAWDLEDKLWWGSLPLDGLTGQIMGSTAKVVLMQYTGFKSKSGAYIYDGDLLKNPNEPTITEVRWSDEDGCWEVYDHDLLAHHYKNLEVVGNIYEELLK